ncbi:MAG: hypothetical protein K8S55_00615, partial [Phycisphaerae bacterium]|nr:hypothetical protein [Phycisphaerae bacterium]
MIRHIFHIVTVTILSAVVCMPVVAAVPAASVERAESYFLEAMSENHRLPLILAGLRSTEDKDLLPLFASL